ncbi:DUF1131 family protein [Stappia sp. GBMRC 2046]|uniref:DUF1131 family protein n=1 Tax=Stappia sediminis TaxID=2692190 RepID=A0A7X3LV84_9HYPH|nr:DUF1131 family protein [Stappia sediminis]MXN65766.1 DUF1131 family protein [Stappia sediminis]
MRRTAAALVLMLAFATASCSSAFDDGPVLSSRNQGATLVEISRESVGGIDGSTAYSARAIEAALPGFTTEGLQSATETNTEWVTGAFDAEGFQILQVYKGSNGKIREVHGVSDRLKGPNGERIGMSFAQSGISRSNCRVGRDLWRGMAICPARGAENVSLLFAISQYDGPYDRLAPNSELKQAELQRIVWTPPGN